jgi:hypothetical protein
MNWGRLSTATACWALLGLTAAASPAGAGREPAPSYGRVVELAPVSGTVLVQPPGGSLTRLRGPRPVPMGTLVDVERGRARLTSAANRSSTEQQRADFFYGRFRVSQTAAGPPLTVLRLAEGLSCARARGGHPHGLWGSGEGNFRTVGNHGSATVRGTIWWSRDRCDGTLFRVKRGVVVVHDFARHREVELRAGHRYLAAAR